MPVKSDMAAEKFREGYNCAQSLFWAFSAGLGIDGDSALKIACGFGGGMGGKQEVCGAVAGGIMVLGARYGRGGSDDRAATDLTYAKTRELMDRFAEKNGTFICRKLVHGCDLNTEEGKKRFKKNDIRNKVCIPCIRTVVEILEDIL